MKKDAFLLGLVATGGQVLLLRELVASLNGDELFIGTALFGWLLAVALGAWLGGRGNWPGRPVLLFTASAIAVPLTVGAAHLAPVWLGATTGEVPAFLPAAGVSVLIVLPVGLLAGWLFPAVSRQGAKAETAITTVYLYEGIGAFAAGILITLTVGSYLATPAAALVLSAVAVTGGRPTGRYVPALAVSLVVVVAVATLGSGGLSRWLDSLRYSGYRVTASFDTHYGHETILERDSMIALLTDNSVEGTYPDWETAENLLLPALLYRPAANRVLFSGRAELGMAQVAAELGGVAVVAVDPRDRLTAVFDSLTEGLSGLERIDMEFLEFVQGSGASVPFEIVILDPGPFDNYKNSRTVTPEYLAEINSLLTDSGVVCLVTEYDTERYISEPVQELLAVIYHTLQQEFANVTLWPGSRTLFFASRAPVLDIPVDSLVARVGRLQYEPDYVNAFYLRDRLNPLRTDRVAQAVQYDETVNTLQRPLLVPSQLAYRTLQTGGEAAVIRALRFRAVPYVIVPLAILLLWGLTLWRDGRRRFGLFLYFAAGAVSLAVELTVFYVHQTLAGSLYSELAVLVGAFMVGLAAGTYFALRMPSRRGLEYPSLVMLGAALVLYLFTYEHVPVDALLVYHVPFLFAVAAATGSLFVAATARYYPEKSAGNRGIGYAIELVGSCLAALLLGPVLLPVIGMTALLVSLVGLTVLALAGAFVSRR